MRTGVIFPELTFEVMTFLIAGPCSPCVPTPPLSRNNFVLKKYCAGTPSSACPPKSDLVHPQPYKTPLYCCQIGSTSPKHVNTCMCEYSGANSGGYQGPGEKNYFPFISPSTQTHTFYCPQGLPHIQLNSRRHSHVFSGTQYYTPNSHEPYTHRKLSPRHVY